jgi:DNA-binding NarL/FixJ family response regulator
MRILVVEDDALHRSFLREAVERMLPECNGVIEAGDGADAIRISREHQLDSIVMDLQMPAATGVDAARTIWHERPDTRILFWSNYADEAYVRGVARIVPPGAVYGYLLKSASEERLRLAMRGVFIEDQCVIDREVRGVQQRAQDRLDGLTDPEYEVLLDIALGLTDKVIAARRNLSTRGVQSRLKHLYEKLGVEHAAASERRGGATYNARTRAVSVAFSRGLLNAGALRTGEDELADWLSRDAALPGTQNRDH